MAATQARSVTKAGHKVRHQSRSVILAEDSYADYTLCFRPGDLQINLTEEHLSQYESWLSTHAGPVGPTTFYLSSTPIGTLIFARQADAEFALMDDGN
jgi:hypothetical protein